MSKGSPDVTATFRNVSLTGDMINARTAEGTMSLSFKSAGVTGALSTGTAQATGPEPTAETFRLIGEVDNTLSATKEPEGLSVDLDGASRWVVTRPSYLTRFTVARGAVVAGTNGRPATMTVDGRAVPIAAGTYRGRIVVMPG